MEHHFRMKRKSRLPLTLSNEVIDYYRNAAAIAGVPLATMLAHVLATAQDDDWQAKARQLASQRADKLAATISERNRRAYNRRKERELQGHVQ